MKPSDYIRKGWCQRHFALDDHKNPCNSGSRLACAWCLQGAVNAAYPYDEPRRERVLARLQCATKDLGITIWNDNPARKQQEVIALLESIGE